MLNRLRAATFSLLFALYALLLAPLVLGRLESAVRDQSREPLLGWAILIIALLETPALYCKIQAVVQRLKILHTGEDKPEPPGLLFACWLAHFVIAGVLIFAVLESLGLGTNEGDTAMNLALGALIVREFWLGGFLFLARGRAIPGWLEFLSDIALLAFACAMHTVFWQFAVESSDRDEYSLVLMSINLVLMAFFFLIAYGATQIPYLWEASVRARSEKNEYWWLAVIGTALLAVAPILYAGMAGRYTTLEDALANRDEARLLVLAREERRDLSPRIRELGRLESLFLHGNQLSELPDEIGRLPELRLLQISYNRLERLPESISGLRELRILKAYGNRLRELPEAIGRLRRLNELHAGWNPITRLPDSIGELSDLETLNLSHCKLRALPESIGQLRSLRVVKLPGNQLRELPRSFYTLPDLRELDLSGNPLTPETRRRLAASFPELAP